MLFSYVAFIVHLFLHFGKCMFAAHLLEKPLVTSVNNYPSFDVTIKDAMPDYFMQNDPLNPT